MALNIIGTASTGLTRGVEVTQTGIICRRHAVRYYPEINDRLAGITGETIVKAISAEPARDITIEGEVNGATGLMAFDFGVAIAAASITNDIDTFKTGAPGAIPGIITLDEATETQDRTGWRSVSVRLSSSATLV